jgi:hypothetical protein
MDIDSIYDLPYNDRHELCKILGVLTIWVVRPKPDAKFLTFEEIVNKYNIEIKDRTLPFRIDDWPVDYPQTILADENEIVELDKNTNLKGDIIFIDIITKHPRVIEKHRKRGG